MNPIIAIDGYKLDHRRQYPDKTQFVYSNWTPRSSRIPDVTEVVFFGLQYFLDKYMGREFEDFFNGDIDEIADKYERRVNGYLGPNSIGTEHIRELHALGYLPLEFRGLPEGRSVPLGVPMLTVENTHERFAWLVNYFETLMSAELWLPCTSATTAKRMRGLLEKWAAATGSPMEFVDWQGHDFSFRGMSGYDAAAVSGMGHLVSFTGTDTIPAIEFVEDYYPVQPDTLVGGSVPATEHSVMCAGGQDDERETYERLLNLYPAGILSVVSDTWDLWKVLTETVPALKDKILAREGKLVIRPDSGDPVKIVCGDPEAPEGSPAHKGVVQLLWDTFGGTVTETGHRLLDSHIGVIYGDGINFQRASDILAGLAENKFASANMVFGMGSYTYQMTTRDVYGFAMKATWVQIDGVGTDIFKKPVTDDGGKFSHKGRLAVLEDTDGNYRVINGASGWMVVESALKPVWRNGKFLRRYSFEEVRANARS